MKGFIISDPRISADLAAKIAFVLKDAAEWADRNGTCGVERNDFPAGLEDWQEKALKSINEELELAIRVSFARVKGNVISGDADCLGPCLEAISHAMEAGKIPGPIFLAAESGLCDSPGVIAAVGPAGWNWSQLDDFLRDPEKEMKKLNESALGEPAGPKPASALKP